MDFKIILKILLGKFLHRSTLLNNMVVTAALPMSAAFQRMIGRGMHVNDIIDVGGSDGRWSLETMAHFPNAHYYIIEANSIHESKLKALKKNRENIDYTIAAAGCKIGEIYFDNSNPFGGRASKVKTSKKLISIPCTTIDNEVASKNLAGPFGIKLDTHGFEVPIIEGALETLKDTQFLVIEAYNFKLSSEESLRFHEMCFYMEKKGFRMIDLAEPLYRPFDKALWQLDIFFIRSDRDEFKTLRYK